MDESDEFQDRLKTVVYKHWKGNAALIYDLVMAHTLTWPSLTVQWLPGKTLQEDSACSIQSCLLGTHTSGASQDYVVITEVLLPEPPAAPSRADKDDDRDTPSPGKTSFEKVKVKFSDTVVIPHEGEVNKARYMPCGRQQQQQQHSPIIATKTVSAEVYVFDSSSYAAENIKLPLEEHVECKPDLRLTGHSTEGYGLAWSHLKQGHLLSGSDDSLVCAWDISATPRSGQRLPALATYTGHTSVVEDVAWHHFNPQIFGSVGDDKQLILWDARKPASQGALIAVQAHEREVNALSFNPANPHLLATCGSCGTVQLRDWRNLAEPLHVLEGHTDQVFQTCWSPHQPTLLGSAGMDRRVHIWDISRIGAAQSREDAQDGPPELLFVHAGQADALNDFSWNCNEAGVVASVSNDNILQVWQAAECIRGGAGGSSKSSGDQRPA